MIWRTLYFAKKRLLRYGKDFSCFREFTYYFNRTNGILLFSPFLFIKLYTKLVIKSYGLFNRMNRRIAIGSMSRWLFLSPETKNCLKTLPRNFWSKIGPKNSDYPAVPCSFANINYWKKREFLFNKVMKKKETGKLRI